MSQLILHKLSIVLCGEMKYWVKMPGDIKTGKVIE